MRIPSPEKKRFSSCVSPVTMSQIANKSIPRFLVNFIESLPSLNEWIVQSDLIEMFAVTPEEHRYCNWHCCKEDEIHVDAVSFIGNSPLIHAVLPSVYRPRPTALDAGLKTYMLVIYSTDLDTMIDFSQLTGFERDTANRDKNWNLHEISWAEAEEPFFHRPLLVYPDPLHSQSEDRFYLLGRTGADRRLFVVFTIRKNKVRVISAREMSKRERKIYNEALKEDT